MEPASLFRVVHSPAPVAEVAALRVVSGPLPASYEKFLSITDGAEWCANDQDGDCLVLWSAREIAELNEAYQISRYVPELLVIGSNGGGSAVGFNRATSSEPEHWPIIRIGFGNLDRTDFVQLAPSFQSWWLGGFLLRPGPHIAFNPDGFAAG